MTTEIDNLVVWPSPFIFWEEVENHQEIKNNFLPKIKDECNDEKYHTTPGKINRVDNEIPSIWNCEVITSYFHRKQLKEQDFFTKEIIESVIKKPLLNFYNLPNCPTRKKPKDYVLKEIWFNSYKPGYYQETHDHSGTTISGIYLLELNEPNTTIFLNYSPSTCQYAETIRPLYETRHIKEGNVILFPSELTHSVEVCSTEKTSISFNILCEY